MYWFDISLNVMFYLGRCNEFRNTWRRRRNENEPAIFGGVKRAGALTVNSFGSKSNRPDGDRTSFWGRSCFYVCQWQISPSWRLNLCQPWDGWTVQLAPSHRGLRSVLSSFLRRVLRMNNLQDNRVFITHILWGWKNQQLIRSN